MLGALAVVTEGWVARPVRWRMARILLAAVVLAPGGGMLPARRSGDPAIGALSVALGRPGDAGQVLLVPRLGGIPLPLNARNVDVGMR